MTDADGRYFIPLASGTYKLTISGKGFAEQTVADVEVAVGVKKRVNVEVESAGV